MDPQGTYTMADEVEHDRPKLPKKLIVCCDGTWMDSDNGWVEGKWGQPGHLQNPSNVTRIARAIKSHDQHNHPQIVYYQAGIGTGLGLWNHIVGGGTGMGLAENVREAYAFLANNYAEHTEIDLNDSIFLIGFSRGAFTARTLGGFICAMGILKKIAMPHFYECFEDWERAGDPHYKPVFFENYYKHHRKDGQIQLKEIHPNYKLAKSKKHEDRDEYLRQYFEILQNMNLTQKVTINAIGVFDTVGALGIPVNPVLQRVFHLPSFFRTYRWFDTRLDDQVKNAYQALALDERRFPYSPAVWELNNGKTNLHQVWFPGAHSNIGGSYSDAGMADITLAWMMDHLSGNMFKQDRPDEWRPRNWIHFDEEYVNYWYDCLLDWYEEHKHEDYKGWGRGKVYDSNTFPQSLAGQRTRKPGCYHGTFYESGKEDKSRLLENTHEYIHSSVRARMDMGGRDVETDWDQVFPHGLNFWPLVKHAWRWLTGTKRPTYCPQKGGPLDGWTLVDGHTFHDDPNYNIDMSPDGLKGVHWKYVGKQKVVNVRLDEAKLGPYEKKLLQKDEALAVKIEFTNNGWRMVRPEPVIREHSHTFPVKRA